MTARDDSILSTGAVSSSFGSAKEQQIRAQKREEKREKRLQLKPVGELVRGEIQKEIDELSNIQFAQVKGLLASGIPNALEIDMLSTEKTIDRLKALQTRFANILREGADDKSEVKQGDSFDE